MHVVTFTGDELESFQYFLQDLRDMIGTGELHTLRLMIDGEGLKISVNRGPWSAPDGEVSHD